MSPALTRNLSVLTAAVLFAGLTFCAKASPFVEVGSAHFQKPQNGIWWQDQYPSRFDLDSAYIRFGYGERLRLSYFSLGHYRTEAVATGEEDRYFSGLCNASTCAPPDYYTTRGSVRGLAISSVLQWGPVYIEPGLTYSRQKFDLFTQVIDERSVNGGPVGKSYRCAEEKSGVGYMLGVGIEYKRVTLSVNYFKNDESSQFGEFPGIDTITTLAVGYRF